MKAGSSRVDRLAGRDVLVDHDAVDSGPQLVGRQALALDHGEHVAGAHRVADAASAPRARCPGSAARGARCGRRSARTSPGSSWPKSIAPGPGRRDRDAVALALLGRESTARPSCLRSSGCSCSRARRLRRRRVRATAGDAARSRLASDASRVERSWSDLLLARCSERRPSAARARRGAVVGLERLELVGAEVEQRALRVEDVDVAEEAVR